MKVITTANLSWDLAKKGSGITISYRSLKLQSSGFQMDLPILENIDPTAEFIKIEELLKSLVDFGFDINHTAEYKVIKSVLESSMFAIEI